ncbi:hypothetical protein PENTCL1PPCAC_12167, partial [Pristionchus entomophagus]
ILREVECMRGLEVLVLLLLSISTHSAPIHRGDSERSDHDVSLLSDSPPPTTPRPPPLLPTVPANRHGIMIWMCQNADVLRIVDEVKQDVIDATDVGNLTNEVYSRLIDFRPNRLWTVYSTLFTTRSTANLLTEDGETTTPGLCFVQFNENPQILVVADLAEVI